MTTNNDKYVERGRMVVLNYDPEWEADVIKANCKKNGAPFQYAEAMFASIATLRSMFQIPYRQLEGMVSEMLGDKNTPSHPTIYRRINGISVNITDSEMVATTPDGTRHVFLATDGSGLKVDNRGEWIRKKWKVRRGFVKMHVLMDIDTGMVLSLRITTEKVGDPKMFVPLLDDALDVDVNATNAGRDGKEVSVDPADDGPQVADDPACADPVTGGAEASRDGKEVSVDPADDGPQVADDPACADPVTGGAEADRDGKDTTLGELPKISILADGAYASREIHKACADRNVTPLIRLKTISIARGKGSGDAWGLAVRDQLGGSPESRIDALTESEKAENQKWKKRVGYGRRWIVEIFFSAFKRIFGESVMARKWDNIVQEVLFKVSAWNRMTAKGDGICSHVKAAQGAEHTGSWDEGYQLTHRYF